jgi:hypothetical protein
MSDAAETLAMVSESGYFGPARVVDIDADSHRVRVLLDTSVKMWVTPALPCPHAFKWGDTVLVAGRPDDEGYIIGLLTPPARRVPPDRALVLGDGVKAAVVNRSGAEALRVFSSNGDLMFEYDARTGKGRMHVPTGDLEIDTPDGNIDFHSQKHIRLHAQESIALDSRQISVAARRGDVHIADAEYSGRRIRGRIDQVKLMIERMESLADTVVSRSKNAYQTVEGLAQLITGRMRTLVDSTYQFKSRKAFLKADADFKIKGEKIHLG